jgi:peptidoglycan/LPS O-acetylase OafA/YrhL
MIHPNPEGAIGTEALRYEALDAWRGIAALGVFLFHLNWMAGEPDYEFAGLPIWNPHSMSSTWVYFFFMLSGFVLAATYRDRLQHEMSVSTFIFRRFWRLYPLNFFTLVGFVVSVPAFNLILSLQGHKTLAYTETFSWRDIPLVLTFFYFVPAGAFAAFWTLSIEWWSSVLFAYASKHSSLSYSKIFLMLITLLAMAAVIGSFIGFHALNGPLRLAFGLCSFFLGALCWQAREGGMTIARLCNGRFSQALAILAVASVMLAPIPFGLIGMFPAFAFLLLAFANDQRTIARQLRRPAWQAIGRWSFSIYLLNPLVMSFSLRLASSVGIVEPGGAAGVRLASGSFAQSLLFAAIVLLSTILASSLSWRYVEEPFLKWSKARTGKSVLRT